MAEQANPTPAPVGTAPTSIAAGPIRDLMQVHVDHVRAGLTVVKVRGCIDNVTAPDLQESLVAAARTNESFRPRILLDLSGVTFLDQVGLDALLHLPDGWNDAVGTIELLAPSPSVVRLLHEANLDGASWMRSVHEAPEDHLPF
jgi:anti-sigma B factor antagonist